MLKVGITGGIGSGKSTVCRLFADNDVAVYDSDKEAKRLMNEDATLRAAIISRFGEESYTAEGLNRKYLADKVFTDEESLQALNALVHPAVKRDFERWAEEQSGDYVVLECAILFESGMNTMVDVTVAVVAPLDLRVSRTCRRDKCDEESVRRRIAAQMSDDELTAKADITIVNIFETDLEPTVKELDYRFKNVRK